MFDDFYTEFKRHFDEYLLNYGDKLTTETSQFMIY
jgi:hypothetical protein